MFMCNRRTEGRMRILLPLNTLELVTAGPRVLTLPNSAAGRRENGGGRYSWSTPQSIFYAWNWQSCGTSIKSSYWSKWPIVWYLLCTFKLIKAAELNWGTFYFQKLYLGTDHFQTQSVKLNQMKLCKQGNMSNLFRTQKLWPTPPYDLRRHWSLRP